MKGDKMAEGVKKKRWMPVVLSVSLALNLAVVAAFAGAAWRHKGDEKMRPPSGNAGTIYMKALPPELRKHMHEKLRKNGKHLRFNPATMISVLRQDPFDPAAAGAVLDAERNAGLAQAEAMSSSWLDGVSAMTDEERHTYADRLQKFADRRAMPKKKRQGD